MTEEQLNEVSFRDLGLSDAVISALDQIGYESPSSIQAQIIPHILEGKDVVGQAQTGTGKTAAFALPLLSRLDLKRRDPQILVLTPTRELAIQVAEAIHRYAAFLPGFHVMPIYGGAGYGGQFRQLERGVHVIVATPGRLCDHLRRGTLQLDKLEALVIDEADEMLNMGFIDDVEWILEQTPAGRQVALFSATMPEPIRRIARQHLKDPVEVTIKASTSTASTIRQRYWMVSGLHKLDAMTRILEGEEFDAIIVFVRTKTMTTELSEKLEARGFASAPLNGDISQALREATVNKLRNGDIDILVATDVAARGLDVPRISHVINYDIPQDTEAYVHRIGRTGRAGRAGDAILFVAPRERRLLQAIEKATKQKIDLMQLPSRESINDIRISRFKQRITDTLGVEDLGLYYDLVEQYRQEHNISALEIAAALARMVQGDVPFLLSTDKPEPAPAPPQESFDDRRPAKPYREKRDGDFGDKREKPYKRRSESSGIGDDGPMIRYRIDAGAEHGVKAGNVIGAIANEAGLEGRQIRNLKIHDEYCTVELPAGLSRDAIQTLKRARVGGRPMNLEEIGGGGSRDRDDDRSERPSWKARSEKPERSGFKPRSFDDKKRKFGSKPPFKDKDKGFPKKFAAKRRKPEQ